MIAGPLQLEQTNKYCKFLFTFTKTIDQLNLIVPKDNAGHCPKKVKKSPLTYYLIHK